MTRLTLWLICGMVLCAFGEAFSLVIPPMLGMRGTGILDAFLIGALIFAGLAAANVLVAAIRDRQ